MIIGSVVFVIGIDHAFSLKDKRKVLNGMKTRLKNKFNVAVSEVGSQDVWNRAELAVVTVSSTRKRVEEVLSNVMNFVESYAEIDVLGIYEEIL